MIDLLKNLIGLNALLVAKVNSAQLLNEAEAAAQAGNLKEARHLLLQSSELGDGNATVQAATLFLKGHGGPCDWQHAAKLFKIAIERGIPNVHLNVGMIYGIGGYGLKRNLEKARYHLQQADVADSDPAAAEMLKLLEKKAPPFGGKEVARPMIQW